MHGNFAEYRKRVLFLAQERGLAELSGEEKRAIIQNTAHFMIFSAPETKLNDWPAESKYCERRECACAVCARLDFLENLTAVPMFQSSGDIKDVGAVNTLLSTQTYMQRWPKIPQEELLASSVIHPEYREMVWLLHTRVVPILPGSFGTLSQISCTAGTAGVGDPAAKVLLCFECASCLCTRLPRMPPAALANDLWIGRYPGIYSKLSQSEKWLLSLGRPCWRKVLLGRKGAPEDERQIGLIGNTILLAQPTAGIPCLQLPPGNEMLGDTLVIAFTGSDVGNLSRCKWAVASKSSYLQAARHRQAVCEAFKISLMLQLTKRGARRYFKTIAFQRQLTNVW